MQNNQYESVPKDKGPAYRSAEGRAILALLAVLGFLSLTAVALYFVVTTSQRLDVPKDTEVGIMAVVATVTLLAIMGQIFVTVLQWKAMKDSVERTDTLIKQNENIIKTAEDSAETARKAYERTDRPWLAVDIGIISPLTFNEQGGHLTFRISTINIGRSVALNATINPAIFAQRPESGMLENVHNAQAQACQSIDSRFMSYAMFPNQPYTVEHTFGFTVPERTEAIGSDFFMLYLVGCIDYQFSGHDVHHQTRFIYEIHATPAENPRDILALANNQDVPIERLLLQKSFMGGDYAD